MGEPLAEVGSSTQHLILQAKATRNVASLARIVRGFAPKIAHLLYNPKNYFCTDRAELAETFTHQA